MLPNLRTVLVALVATAILVALVGTLLMPVPEDPYIRSAGFPRIGQPLVQQAQVESTDWEQRNVLGNAKRADELNRLKTLPPPTTDEANDGGTSVHVKQPADAGAPAQADGVAAESAHPDVVVTGSVPESNANKDSATAEPEKPKPEENPKLEEKSEEKPKSDDRIASTDRAASDLPPASATPDLKTEPAPAPYAPSTEPAADAKTDTSTTVPEVAEPAAPAAPPAAPPAPATAVATPEEHVTAAASEQPAEQQASTAAAPPAEQPAQKQTQEQTQEETQKQTQDQTASLAPQPAGSEAHASTAAAVPLPRARPAMHAIALRRPRPRAESAEHTGVTVFGAPTNDRAVNPSPPTANGGRHPAVR
jgi:hypothetical protein